MIGHYRHALLRARRLLFVDRPANSHNLLHARHRPRARVVHLFRLPAEHGRPLDGCIEHPRQSHIDTEARLPVHLLGRVEARHRLAEQVEILRVLERRILGHGERCRACRELAVTELALRRRVDHRTLLGAARRRSHSPLLRRGSHEHLARGGARLAQRLVRATYAAAPARAHATRPARGILGRRAHAHRCELHLELLGDDHGERCVHALSHLRLVYRDRDDAVGADVHPAVGSKGCRASGSVVRGSGHVARRRPELLHEARREVERDRETGAGRGAGLQEVAAGDSRVSAHRTPPFRRRGGSRGGSAGRYHSGRCCRSWLRRCPHRSAMASS